MKVSKYQGHNILWLNNFTVV